MNTKNYLVAATVMMAVSSVHAFGNSDKTKNDATILSEAQSKITSVTKVNTATAPQIVVDVKEGKVKLYGIVNTKEQKKDAEKAVKDIEGVKDVDSEIMVKE